jgi:multidrug efflux pump
VRDRVSRSLSVLPPDIDTPIVAKADADATPIVFLNVQSDTRSLQNLVKLLTMFLKKDCKLFQRCKFCTDLG